MTVWHVTPEYINRNWTEEQFLLLFKMRNKRIKHENGVTPDTQVRKTSKEVSADAFLSACRVTVQKI